MTTPPALDSVITPRGVGIGCAGIVLGGLGVGFASPVLTYLGVAMAVGVVLGGLWLLLSVNAFVERFPYARREVTPRPLSVGSPGTVVVKVLPGRPMSGSWWRFHQPFSAFTDIREQAAAELTGGVGTKATMARTADSITLTYTLNPSRRGRWPLGPTLVHTSDPMGMFWADTAMGEPEAIPVWPAVHDLSAAAGALMGQADRVVIGARTPSPDDASLRDYHDGDDLRRVHWPSTARRGSMVVRSDERAGRRPATIIIDLPRDPHALERTISTAASIGAAVVESGHPCRLLGAGLDADRSGYVGAQGSHGSKAQLLDLTIDLKAPVSTAIGLTQLIHAATHVESQLHHGEVIIAILEPPHLDAMDALVPLGQSGRAWALIRDDGSGDGPASVTALQRAGWRATTYQAADDLNKVWTAMVSAGGIE